MKNTHPAHVNMLAAIKNAPAHSYALFVALEAVRMDLRNTADMALRHAEIARELARLGLLDEAEAIVSTAKTTQDAVTSCADFFLARKPGKAN